MLFWLLVIFTALVALLTCLIVKYFSSPKLKLSNVSELICLFENNKVLPLTTKTKWVLMKVENGVRVWERDVFCPSDLSMTIIGSFTSLKISPRKLASIIINSKTQKQWNPYLPKDSIFKNFPLNSTVFEREAMYIEMKTIKFGKVFYDTVSRFCNKFMGQQHNISTLRNDIMRCWQEKEDDCLWLVEHSINFSSWVFYLVSPMPEDPEKATISVITTYDPIPPLKEFFLPSHLHNVDPSVIITGLKHFTKTKVPLQPVSLNSIPTIDKNILPSKDESDALELIKSEDSISNVNKEEISLFQKFKNLLDEKKDEPKKLKKIEPAKPSPTPTDSINPIEIIRRFSLSGKLFDEKKVETPLKEKETLNQSKWDVLAKAVNVETGNIKPLHKTSNIENQSKLALYLDTIINNTAQEIIKEKNKVSGLDIKAPEHEQVSMAGGWIYCGLEKDTVILKKQMNTHQPFHTYMGKGVVACPPKMVYEVLKDPQTRLSYDDCIKKIEVLEEYGSDIKIVRYMYEIGHNFKREKRQLILVQGERMEGLKHVITLSSVDWPAVKLQNQSVVDSDCSGDDKTMNEAVYNTDNDDATVDKMECSGWIVEPLMKGNNLCCMLTYVSQIKFKESLTMPKSLSQMVTDIALKQPLCVKHLRNYINSKSALPSKTDNKEDGKKNVTLSFNSAFAKFRNTETVTEEEFNEVNEKFDKIKN